MKSDPIRKYLDKRANLGSHPLAAGSVDGIEQVVVIPVLAEEAYLFDTLSSIAANPSVELQRALVICVVNNRAAPHARIEDIAENRRTLARLDAFVQDRATAGGLRLAYVDASSPGKEIADREGVGLARKIGLDWGLSVLYENAASPGTLLSLDADTLVEATYLESVRRHLAEPGAWAALTSYAHRLDGSPDETAGILCYELFMRYHELGLKWAGSPYALTAIGSTITCRAAAYVAVSGMNRRQAGEDFYFVQELTKTGSVRRLTDTVVHPSSRASWRVPFGTGPRVRAFADNPSEAFLAYHPECYRVIKEWLDAAAACSESPAHGLLRRARQIAPALGGFLEDNDFARTWERLRANARGPDQLLAQFHRWFDGLKTLRLINHLSAGPYPRQNLHSALNIMLDTAGLPPPETSPHPPDNIESQAALLRHLRNE